MWELKWDTVFMLSHNQLIVIGKKGDREKKTKNNWNCKDQFKSEIVSNNLYKEHYKLSFIPYSSKSGQMKVPVTMRGYQFRPWLWHKYILASAYGAGIVTQSMLMTKT